MSVFYKPHTSFSCVFFSTLGVSCWHPPGGGERLAGLGPLTQHHPRVMRIIKASFPRVSAENKVSSDYICFLAQLFVFPGVNNCLCLFVYLVFCTHLNSSSVSCSRVNLPSVLGVRCIVDCSVSSVPGASTMWPCPRLLAPGPLVSSQQELLPG